MLGKRTLNGSSSVLLTDPPPDLENISDDAESNGKEQEWDFLHHQR